MRLLQAMPFYFGDSQSIAKVSVNGEIGHVSGLPTSQELTQAVSLSRCKKLLREAA